MIKKLKKLNPMKKPSKLNLDEVIEEVLKKRSKDPANTYCLSVFHKKDKRVIFFCGKLAGDAIEYRGTYYYVDSTRVYEQQVELGKNKYRIPYVDLYEGITIGFTPYSDIDTRPFSETFQDVISLHIEKGILENKKKKQVNLRKGIAIGLIALAGIYIFAQTLFG